MILFVCFALLFLLATTVPQFHAAPGGQECIFEITYLFYDGDSSPPAVPETFKSRIAFNATGYFNSDYAYEPCNDAGSGGNCDPENYQNSNLATTGAVPENSVKNFTLVFMGETYALDYLYVQHLPIGYDTRFLEYDELLSDYFDFFTFDGHSLNSSITIENSDPFLIRFVLDVDVYAYYWVDDIARVGCSDTAVPFDSVGTLRYFEDGDNEWIVVAEGDTVQDWFDFGEIDVRHDNEFGDSAYFIDGIILMQRTKTNYGPAITTYLHMGDGLGQIMRLKFYMDYTAFPNDRGSVCIYFDYFGIDNEVEDDDYEILETMPGKIWCGKLDNTTNHMSVELPMNYGPASWCVDFGDAGYTRYRPLIISGNPLSSFIIEEFGFEIMGQDYCGDSCYDRRRRESDVEVEGGQVKGNVNASIASWTAWKTAHPATPHEWKGKGVSERRFVSHHLETTA